jgi:FKBP-type peptidyl-prolyl cis-trans isomerase/Leucine-rich repeat (LRR) protein
MDAKELQVKKRLVISTWVILIIILVPILAACGNDSDENDGENADENTITTASGLQYFEIQEGNGPMPLVGDSMAVNYTLTLEDSTKVESSLDSGKPYEFALGFGEVIPGWDEGVALMKEGGIAKLTIPPSLGYGGVDHGNIPGNSILTLDVDLVSVTSREGDAITTASGLKYIPIREGTGPAPQTNDMVKVDYTGTLVNGSQFDNSFKRGEPIQFALGTVNILKGWNEGIAMMKEGGRARLVIPPELGYGDQDMGTIPPNSTLIFAVELVSVTPATIVTIPDSNLEAAVREAIGKSEGDISSFDLENLTSLIADDKGIIDLTGLEHCTGLITLKLPNNQISDLSPLSGLVNLTKIDLAGNQLSDIAPLANLTNLTDLSLGENRVSDLSPLSELTSLTHLRLYENEIKDVSPISGLTNLVVLDLWGNQLTDISPLGGLTNLITVSLFENRISDISPLSGLVNLTKLELWGNQLSDIASLSSLISLTELDLWDNQISDISGLSSLNKLTELSLAKNQISDVSALSNLTSLIHLGLYKNQVSDVSDLSELTSLTKLYLWENRITDISPLSGLTSLKTLSLSQNQITDISALSGLASLTWLELQNNRIEDIAPLVADTGLKEGSTVDLTGNPLSAASLSESVPKLEKNGVTVKK